VDSTRGSAQDWIIEPGSLANPLKEAVAFDKRQQIHEEPIEH
jgi:hypothetical protein